MKILSGKIGFWIISILSLIILLFTMPGTTIGDEFQIVNIRNIVFCLIILLSSSLINIKEIFSSNKKRIRPSIHEFSLSQSSLGNSFYFVSLIGLNIGLTLFLKDLIFTHSFNIMGFFLTLTGIGSLLPWFIFCKCAN